jgi:uncharacterized protein (DUF427 family)
VIESSDHLTACPYKGFGSYHHVKTEKELHENIVPTHRTPVPDANEILGLLAFFDEKVDVTVDGDAKERPKTVCRKS